MKRNQIRFIILTLLVILLFLVVFSDLLRGREFFLGPSQIVLLVVILISLGVSWFLFPVLCRIPHKKVLGDFRKALVYVYHQAVKYIELLYTNVGRLIRRIHPILNVIFIVLLVGTQLLAIKNFVFLLTDIVGNSSNTKLVVPRPEYLYRRIPENPISREFGAVGRLGLDFAQIYFPSKSFSSLISNYESGSFDPWNRQSRYAPLVHYLCAISICRLDYGLANATHILFQVVLFYLFFIYAFWIFGIKKDLLLSIAFINIFLFLTPAGLAWMERGQYSLYIAIAYLLSFLGFRKRSFFLIFLSSIFSFIKWTSFPTIFVIFAVSIICSQDRNAQKTHFFMGLEFASIILFLNLLFPEATSHFLLGLFTQEALWNPDGNSLALVYSKSIVKFLPLIFICLGLIYIKINNKVTNWFYPLLIGSGISLVIYPTLAYDYNVPNLYVFIPLFLYWSMSHDNTTPLWLNHTMKYSFFIFIYLVSNSEYINVWSHNRFTTIYLYIFTSAIFILLPMFFSLRWKTILPSKPRSQNN